MDAASFRNCPGSHTCSSPPLPPTPISPLRLPLPLLCLRSHPLTLCFYFRFLFLYIYFYTRYLIFILYIFITCHSPSPLPLSLSAASRDPLLCSYGCWGFCGFSVNAKFAQQFAHVPLASELFKGATVGAVYGIQYSVSNTFSFFNLTVTKQCVQLCWGRTFYAKPWVE